MEMHMPVQAGAQAVDEGDCTDVQGCLVRMRCAWAVGLQGLLNYFFNSAINRISTCLEKSGGNRADLNK
jgi:hypothetical protein